MLSALELSQDRVLEVIVDVADVLIFHEIYPPSPPGRCPVRQCRALCTRERELEAAVASRDNAARMLTQRAPLDALADTATLAL